MASTARSYTTRRSAITKALADKMALIDGRGIYHTAVAETSPRLKLTFEVLETVLNREKKKLELRLKCAIRQAFFIIEKRVCMLE